MVNTLSCKHQKDQALPSLTIKKTHSIVLMAVSGAHYKFNMMDIGDSGHNSDGGVFSSSRMGDTFFKKQLNVSKADILLGTKA